MLRFDSVAYKADARLARGPRDPIGHPGDDGGPLVQDRRPCTPASDPTPDPPPETVAALRTLRRPMPAVDAGLLWRPDESHPALFQVGPPTLFLDRAGGGPPGAEFLPVGRFRCATMPDLRIELYDPLTQ